MKKKILIIILAFSLVFITACSKETEEPVLNTEEPMEKEVVEEVANKLLVDGGFVIDETINNVKVNIVIPRVLDNVVDGDLINQDIPYAGLDGYDSKEDLEKTIRDYNIENEYSPMTSITIDYELLMDNLNISVLSIKTLITFEASGDLTSYIVYYYDNNTNQLISNTKTLGLHGYTMDDAYQEVIAKDEVVKEFYDPENSELGTISAVYYYFDENGKLQYYHDFWM